jgi:hypothetical protein
MRSAKVSIDGLIHYLKNNKIFKIKTVKQKSSYLLRYSKNYQFSDKIINKFFKLEKFNVKYKRYSLYNLFER